MAQDWGAVTGPDKIKDTYDDLLGRTETLKSNFSGTAFPSSNLLAGMTCWRTDDGELHILVDLTPTWEQIPVGVPVSIEQGGTGGTTASAARTNLELGDLALLDTVGGAQIADGAVGTSELADDAVVTVKIGNAQVTADKLATGAVITAKIGDAQVTGEKLASGAVATNLGFTPANAAGQNFTGAVQAVGELTAFASGENFAVVRRRRQDSTPTDGSIVGGDLWIGRNSNSEDVTFSEEYVLSEVVADGTERGRRDIQVRIAGAMVLQGSWRDGLIIGLPDGGWKGTGTLNAEELWEEGTRVLSRVEGASFSEQQGNGTAGGTFSSGGWRHRAQNTTRGSIGSSAALSSGDVVLQAGTWLIEWSAVGHSCGNHQTRLWNQTDSTLVAEGSAARSGNDESQTPSVGSAVVTISAEKTFRLQHACGNTRLDDGFGAPGGFGINEVYSSVRVSRIAR